LVGGFHRWGQLQVDIRNLNFLNPNYKTLLFATATMAISEHGCLQILTVWASPVDRNQKQRKFSTEDFVIPFIRYQIGHFFFHKAR
jgi:hypothetical protein